MSKIWHQFEAGGDEEIEEVLVSVVVAVLHLVEIERELPAAHAVVLEELPLGMGPEALEPVDVHLPAGELPRVVEAPNRAVIVTAQPRYESRSQ